MSQAFIEAVFEDGVFRPLDRAALAIPNGQHVRLIVETEAVAGDPLTALVKVFQGMTEEEIQQVEEIALDRSNFMRPPAE